MNDLIRLFPFRTMSQIERSAIEAENERAFRNHVALSLRKQNIIGKPGGDHSRAIRPKQRSTMGRPNRTGREG